MTATTRSLTILALTLVAGPLAGQETGPMLGGMDRQGAARLATIR